MAWEVLSVTHFLASGLMLLLAGWLLWLNFDSRVHRAFALFLLLRALVTLSHRLAALLPADEAFWTGLAGYFILGATFALGHFLVVYTARGRTSRRRLVLAGLAVTGALVEIAYAFDHCLLRCAPAELGGYGPLSLLTFGLTFLYASAGVLLARESARDPTARGNAAALVAAAFLLQAVLESAIVLGVLVLSGVGFLGSDPWAGAAFILRAAALPVAVWGIVILARDAPAVARVGIRARVLVGAAAAAGLSGIYQAVPVVAPQLSLSATFLTGFWLFALPVLVTFAIVRHRLFDVDVKLRGTIARGPLAFALLAAFFVGAEVAQSYLSTEYGLVAGGIMAGLLLFALHPLQRMGERLADGVAPRGKPVSAMSHRECLDLYLAQATLAWADGSLARKERMLLDSLRERLGITAEEALQAEREAVVMSPR